MARQYISIRTTGLNNIDDPVQLPREALIEGQNILIRKDASYTTRDGLTQVTAGTDMHSLWSNGTMSFVADGSTLYRRNADNTLTSIATLGSSSPLDYLDTPGGVVATSLTDSWFFATDWTSYDISSYQGVSGALDTLTSEEFAILGKVALPKGQFIAFLSPHIYIAQGSKLFWSDPYSIETTDPRFNWAPMPEVITMLRGTNDGLWIAYGDTVAYIAGRDPASTEFDIKLRAKVIPGSATVCQAHKVGSGKPGLAVVFTTEDGVYVGFDGGAFEKLTDGMAFGPDTFGAGRTVDINGCSWYLTRTAADNPKAFTRRAVTVDEQTI